jgi:hypothetical protein
MDFQQTIATLHATGASVCNIRFTCDEVRKSLSASGLPQLYFDGFRDVRKILSTLREPTVPAIAHRLTRKGLEDQKDRFEWQASESLQLDQYDAQGDMSGKPCAPAPGR